MLIYIDDLIYRNLKDDIFYIFFVLICRCSYFKLLFYKLRWFLVGRLYFMLFFLKGVWFILVDLNIIIILLIYILGIGLRVF